MAAGTITSHSLVSTEDKVDGVQFAQPPGLLPPIVPPHRSDERHGTQDKVELPRVGNGNVEDVSASQSRQSSLDISESRD